MVAQLCEQAEKLLNLNFKWVTCMIHELYHSKAII